MDNDKYSSDSPVYLENEDKFSRWSFAERKRKGSKKGVEAL